MALGNHSYTSADVFHAMACADLTEEDKLTFLVVKLHVGPSKQGQVFVACCQVFIFKLRQLLCLKFDLF